MSDTRLGVHTGCWQNAFVNCTPRAASVSMFGVLATALPKHPSASARSWSGMKSTTFGRPGTAAPYDASDHLTASLFRLRGTVGVTRSRLTKGGPMRALRLVWARRRTRS